MQGPTEYRQASCQFYNIAAKLLGLSDEDFGQIF
jgi:hypothetical protein